MTSNLLRISAQMKRSRPVFIVGEARSGTSILYRTLQKHPSFRPRQASLVETDIFAYLRRVFMFGPSFPQSLVRFMLDDAAEYERFLRSIRLPRVVSALLVGPNLLLRDRSELLYKANAGDLVVRSYFFHASRARGCRRLVEKTPTNTANLGRLASAFPLARFIYIHRHPVDVFGSYRRRSETDPDARWAREVDVGSFCERYETSTQRVLRWRRNHTDLHLVRYESFTRDPGSEFRLLCEFLNEPFFEDAVREDDPDVTRWYGDPYLWGEIVPVTKDWSDYVAGDEADLIQRRLAGVMRSLAYSAYDTR